VLIVAGTDVGNPYRFPGYAIHEELAFYVSAGLTPADALATATVNAARLVGDGNKWGSLREGLAADVVILGANPLDDIGNTRTIRQVIRGGHIVNRGELPVRYADACEPMSIWKSAIGRDRRTVKTPRSSSTNGFLRQTSARLSTRTACRA
jgi:adenine deaminase